MAVPIYGKGLGGGGSVGCDGGANRGVFGFEAKGDDW